jgi:hypothetical protein
MAVSACAEPMLMSEKRHVSASVTKTAFSGIVKRGKTF